MTSRAIQHNPLIQALQLAGADWLWPGEALSVFWRTTTETMTQAGWAGYSNPWQWKDIHAAHLQRLGMPDCDALNGGFRLEACAAVWLHDKSELLTHWGGCLCIARRIFTPHRQCAMRRRSRCILGSNVGVFDLPTRLCYQWCICRMARCIAERHALGPSPPNCLPIRVGTVAHSSAHASHRQQRRCRIHAHQP